MSRPDLGMLHHTALPVQPHPLFVACWSTGPDPVQDGVFYLEATRFGGDQAPVSPIPPTWLRPFASLPAGAPLSRRLAGLGMSGPSSAELPTADDELPGLLTRLADQPIILSGDSAPFLLRFRRFCPGQPEPRVLGVEELASFLHPQRGARSFAALCERWLHAEAPQEPLPADLRRLTEALIRAHFERPSNLRQLFARTFDDLEQVVAEEHPAASGACDIIRSLLDRPSYWSSGEDLTLFEEPLEDGLFTDDLADAPLEVDRILRDLELRFAAEYQVDFAKHKTLEARCEEPTALNDADVAIMERFYDLVPKDFAGGGAERERPGQRSLARSIADAFGRNGYLIADAPTGTGKTLGYLAPLLLWSSRTNTRTGLSTYTRALQEQAFFREVPRALRLLQEAGLPKEQVPRVALLKGRSNYICGRAIQDAAPESGVGSAVARATWLRLVLFYAEDPTADLDGFSHSPGILLGNPARAARRAAATVTNTRAMMACCFGKAASRCAASVARMRAERAHVVVTNHAFVLARTDYFSHLLFDECDHLHEVTVSERSWDVDLQGVIDLCHRLLVGRGRDSSPFQRMARLLTRLDKSDIPEPLLVAAERGPQAARALDAAAHEVDRQLRAYRKWAAEASSDLSPEERAWLLRDYLESGRGDPLATALRKLHEVIDDLDVQLRVMVEELGRVPFRGANRVRGLMRRPFELIETWREGLNLWVHGDFGEAQFNPDLHTEAVFKEGERRPTLCLKWLLPQEWLGQTYFPSLLSAGFVSATCRLQGGFGPMKGYLGLDLLGDAAPERPVEEFSGPPTFDPTAQLTCIPKDAPPYRSHGPAFEDWLDYVEDTLLFLGERTRGRTLGLFTNRKVLQRVGERLGPAFAARGIPLLWQGMPGLAKEEIMEQFRAQVDSVLLGLDTFWYGVDFPGETCQYVVVTKLPYGLLDDYLFAQRARLGWGPHRAKIYLPKALAMFRQGCGRLLRNEDDRGALLILDRRVLEKRHADFLRELPGGMDDLDGPNILADESDTCLHRIFAHMGLGAEIERRGLEGDFSALRNRLPQTGSL